jgi:NADPH:quinone reductase-like Zn-dependent oxidoreductase
MGERRDPPAYRDAPTRTIAAAGAVFAYRELARQAGVLMEEPPRVRGCRAELPRPLAQASQRRPTSTSTTHVTRMEQHAMRAFVVDRYKGPVREADMPEPAVGEHDVLVRVQAAGLNLLDEKIRAGEFKQILPYTLPLILGNDVAGTVLRVGAKVGGFTPGDEVYARPDKDRIGTFAERIAVAEADLALKPTSISIQEAGSLPLVALTAWQALVERGNVRPGQKVLIHAGAGGVGSIAIQLAKHLGATVATTASGSNAGFVRALGADTVIDYRSQDFEQLLDGYDLVLDSLGGTNLEKSLRVLRPGGKAIGIAGPPDPAFAREIGLNPVLRLVITGLSAGIRCRARTLGVSYEFLFMRANGDQLRQIAALVDSGALRPVVGRVFPVDQTVQALQSLDKGGIRGKAVISNP